MLNMGMWILNMELTATFVDFVGQRTELSDSKLQEVYQHLSSSPDGVAITDVESNRMKFGVNEIPQQAQTTFIRLLLNGFDDRIIQILSVASIISLGTGLYEYFYNHVEMAYIEGLAIISTIFIVIFINAYQDYQKDKQFKFLNEQNQSNKKASVLRKQVSGDVESSRMSFMTMQIPVSEIVAGDILLIANGDIIPADGYLISFSSLKLDESSLTGESEPVEKNEQDKYIISGSKVVDGMGKMIVLAVGISSQNGKLLMSLRTPSQFTPLQTKLNAFGNKIAKFGFSAAFLIFLLSLVKYFYFGHDTDPFLIFQSILHFLISAITVIVVAVPEGLPMAVTLSLSVATIQMMKDNNLVRVLSSCETMGNCTVICSDKTGTLTRNKMTVMSTFLDFKDTGMEHVHPDTLELVCQSLNVNSTAHEVENEQGTKSFIGNTTEIALLEMCRPYSNYIDDRKCTMIKQIPFSSDRKRMTTIIKVKESNRLYCKGASEIVLANCTTFIIDGQVCLLTDNKRKRFTSKINKYAAQGLRTIAFAFKRVEESFEDDELTLIGLVGIQDPVRPEVPEAVKTCQQAGIVVIMVTGDNINTAKSIAKECNIYNDSYLAIEGPEFRKMSSVEIKRMLPNLRILARSLPSDKQLLVKSLKELNEIVAVTGDGTNDGPALKEADVGFSMGITGTEVAKEASDIVLIDDNFSSLVKAIIWGRSVFDSVRKFLQFQLTVNIVAVLVAITSVLLDEDNESILTAVQLLWVNLIMDSFGALALATDVPDPSLLKRRPYRRNEPLISFPMWKMILGQAIYQYICSMILLRVKFDIYKNADSRSLVFNAFVLMQIFNLLNARRIGDKQFNIFKNIFKNKFFLPLWIFMFIMQVALIEIPFFQPIFKTAQLGFPSWGVTLVIGVGSLFVGIIIKLLPTKQNK